MKYIHIIAMILITTELYSAELSQEVQHLVNHLNQISGAYTQYAEVSNSINTILFPAYQTALEYDAKWLRRLDAAESKTTEIHNASDDEVKQQKVVELQELVSQIGQDALEAHEFIVKMRLQFAKNNFSLDHCATELTTSIREMENAHAAAGMPPKDIISEIIKQCTKDKISRDNVLKFVIPQVEIDLVKLNDEARKSQEAIHAAVQHFKEIDNIAESRNKFLAYSRK